MTNEEYLDSEVEQVQAYAGPAIRFSHIDANEDGLRPYQSDLKHKVYKEWDHYNNVMLQMPTGTGKTIVFTSIVCDVQRWCMAHQPEAKILIVAHRKELIEQASDKLGRLLHGIIQSGKPMHLDRMVQVASIQTFMSHRNYDTMSGLNFCFIIIDEAHHSMAPGYQKLWEMFPQSKKLGVTATPWRMSHSGFTRSMVVSCFREALNGLSMRDISPTTTISLFTVLQRFSVVSMILTVMEWTVTIWSRN